jgi:EmrB/QacA subfamily drug resistance transporter
MSTKAPAASAPMTPYQRLALTVILIGVLITAVDTTIVVLALPTMMASLKSPLSGAVWVILSYLLVITLLATQVGRIGDMFGRVRIYEYGFLVFIIGSLLCGIAGNEAQLILFRILQGIGGAFVTANSGAVIADTFPPEVRGRAYGFNSIGWNLGAILGILLGGLITTYFSWRWIFLINVPIGGFAFILALRTLKDKGERVSRTFDWAGMLLLGAGLLGVLLALTRLSSGENDAVTWIMMVVGAVLVVIFVFAERAMKAPALDLSIFRIPVISASLLASFFQSLGNYAVLFLLIMYLQGVRGLTPLHASLLLVPGYLVGGVVGPLAGRITDKVGVVLPATLGLLMQAIAIFLYAHLGVPTALWFVVLGSIINGIGAGGFFPANNAAVMKAAPTQSYGIVSGMLRTFANIGMVLSFAMAILVASASIPRGLVYAVFVGATSISATLMHAFDTGIHHAFYFCIAMMVLAAIGSALRGRRKRTAAT